ncbi:hypothetical protein AYO45_03000 [Gammaproteobacteria bacterium SCGC AG-212-F23]|nr:hypothetical protein AYO45_03000 [Gammaproteobacteria bacterium SCGC AG-212-F23]
MAEIEVAVDDKNAVEAVLAVAAEEVDEVMLFVSVTVVIVLVDAVDPLLALRDLLLALCFISPSG